MQFSRHKRLLLLAAIFASLVLAGCEKEAVEAIGLEKKLISIKAEDGKHLAAHLYLPVTKNNSKLPGVVLLGPFLETRLTYDRVDSALAHSGMLVLSVDVRGSGESEGSGGDFDPSFVRDLPRDAKAALDYLASLPQVDSKRLAVLGTGITARAAVLGAGTDKNVRAVVLVSAALDSVGLAVIRQTPFRAVLTICSFQDAYAGAQAKLISEASQHRNSEIKVFMNAGEGSEIWWSHARPEMALYIIDWLSKVL